MKSTYYRVLKYIVVFLSVAFCYWMNENTLRLLQSDNILPLLTFTIAFNNALNVVLIFFIASRFLMDERDERWVRLAASEEEGEVECEEPPKSEAAQVENKV